MIFDNLKQIEGHYEIVYSDPPWKQTKGGIRKSRPNQTKELDYETLTMTDIIDHQKYIRDSLTTKNHTVFMWTIDKFLHETEQFMKELGYKLHARVIWDKENGVAPAFTIRYTHEYLLWFYKDKMIPIDISQRGKYTTVLREKSTKHSKKPLCAYRLIEGLYPTQSKIEMYARNIKDGWDSWGNEVT